MEHYGWVKAAAASAVAVLALITAAWRVIVMPNLKDEFVTAENCKDCKQCLGEADNSRAEKVELLHTEISMLREESRENNVNIKWIMEILKEKKDKK